jgi:hypothetical protein
VPTCRVAELIKFEFVINLKRPKGARPSTESADHRRRGDRMNNCHLVAWGSLKDRAAGEDDFFAEMPSLHLAPK